MIWVGRLISIAAVLQTIELFWIRPFRSDLMAPEFPKALRWILKFYRPILFIRLIAAGVALFVPSIPTVAILLFSTWAIAVRWRGTFNGGSDFMTFHILAAWLLSLVLPPLEKACLYYIAIQLILSYFVAGVSKISNPSWRSGWALHDFLNRWGQQWSPTACFCFTWIILAFETLFPLSLVKPWPFLVAGFLFHLTNTYIFGLNRFLFAWLAAYPAILVLANRLAIQLSY